MRTPIRVLTIAATLVAASLVTPAATASAAPCQFQQHDVAGTYVSTYMRLDVYPCGGAALTWGNAYGWHVAGYQSIGRLQGDGLMVQGVIPNANGSYMDSSLYLGIKPAERGYIELGTYYPSFDLYDMPVQNVYRLRKVS